MEGHGGTIEVESIPGRGTLFRVELPLAADLASIGAAGPPAPAPASGPGERPHVVLVVDDEREVASLLADVLAEEGHEVDTADSAEAALDRLAARRYDAVLSDLRMPGLDGPALYRQLARSHPELARRFVAVTGDALSPDIAAFLAESAVPTLTKPFTPADVRRVLREVLGSRRAG